MFRRTLTLAAASAVASAGLIAGAPIASADDACNTTTDPQLTLTVCATPYVPTVIYRDVPIYIHTCVDTTCVGPLTRTVKIPSNITDPADVSVSGCVWAAGRCVNFNDDVIIAIGGLPPLPDLGK